MSGVNSIKLCSFNIKGIHHPIRCKKILSSLKKEKVHVAFLQGTHLVDNGTYEAEEGSGRPNIFLQNID